MDLSSIRKIHLIGVGGIGISAIAKLLLKQNKIVTGSDIVETEIIKDLKNNGLLFYKKHSKKNLAPDTDLVIYSKAVRESNIERKKAKELNILQLSYPEFLGEISKNKFTIAVSGTNGKSTTTAILGLILEKAGFDPLVIVGSKVLEWNSNLRLPEKESKIFLVEACEWQANFLNLFPNIIILTNLEEDHLDYYKDINHLIKTFQTYVEKLPKNGLLILNSDDDNLKKIKPKCKVVFYGIKNKADVEAKNIKIKNRYQEFSLFYKSKFITKIRLNLIGLFNVYNALAAIACALSLKVNPYFIKKVLKDFYGIWRRFQIVKPIFKNVPNVIYVSDYAHHPTAIKETIKGALDFYPNRRILVVFQPHHQNRTKKLFNQFVESFDLADLVIVSEIYKVFGREDKRDFDISSKDLVKAILKRIKMNKKIRLKKVFYAKNLKEVKKKLKKIVQPKDLVLIMGAGDIYKLAPS
jgi:UDP-N-acetylmuramate--alanine ligase